MSAETRESDAPSLSAAPLSASTKMPMTSGHAASHQSAELRFAYTVSSMLVDCVRVIHTDAYSPKHLGASLEEMFVSFAVHIGTAEDRPMSATKIAGFLGVPRTNVLRALAALKRKNVIYSVGNVYLTNVDRLGKRITPALVRKQINTIARAHAVLAKLEASILAK